LIIGSQTVQSEIAQLQQTDPLSGIPALVLGEKQPDMNSQGHFFNQQDHPPLQTNETELRGKTVLLVDDDMRNIYSLTHVLEEEGIQVISAYNGRQAINQLEIHQEVDVVLMDMMMPELNGYEATRLIRQREKWKMIPIIAVTAQAMQGDREKCMDAGASDFLSKPVKTEELLSLLKVWMYR
jgi:CheY-like chemotaxis protein